MFQRHVPQLERHCMKIIQSWGTGIKNSKLRATKQTFILIFATMLNQNLIEMKRILSLALVALITLTAAAQQTTADEAYRTEMKRYLELTNSEATFISGMKSTFVQLAKAGGFPADIDIDLMAKDVAKAVCPLMVDDYATVYKKYLTLEELRAVNDFYTTPAGKKLAASAPQITTESSQFVTKYAPVINEVMKRHLPQ